MKRKFPNHPQVKYSLMTHESEENVGPIRSALSCMQAQNTQVITPNRAGMKVSPEKTLHSSIDSLRPRATKVTCLSFVLTQTTEEQCQHILKNQLWVLRKALKMSLSNDLRKNLLGTSKNSSLTSVKKVLDLRDHRL